MVMRAADFRDKPAGYGITTEDMKEACYKINYTIKPLDIVLIWTGAGAYNDSRAVPERTQRHDGRSDNWLLDRA